MVDFSISAIGGRRQRDDHQRDALVAILEAGKVLAHGHSRRRHQPDAGTGGIDDIGRLRRGGENAISKSEQANVSG